MGLWVCVRDLDHPEPPAWPGRVKQSPLSQGHSASYRIPENKRNKTHSHGECFSSCKLPFIQQLQAAGKSQTSRVHRLATPRTAGGGDLLAGLDKQVPKNSFLLSSRTQLLSRAGPGASFGSLHGVMAQEQEQHQTAQAQPSSERGEDTCHRPARPALSQPRGAILHSHPLSQGLLAEFSLQSHMSEVQGLATPAHSCSRPQTKVVSCPEQQDVCGLSQGPGSTPGSMVPRCRPQQPSPLLPMEHGWRRTRLRPSAPAPGQDAPGLSRLPSVPVPASAQPAHQFSLLIWSPKPGVSMTVSFMRTPFSSISEMERKAST